MKDTHAQAIAKKSAANAAAAQATAAAITANIAAEDAAAAAFSRVFADYCHDGKEYLALQKAEEAEAQAYKSTLEKYLTH